MKKLLPLLALGLALGFGAAHADDKKEPSAQQSKMASCNKAAGDKKGDERKAFMSDCLKAKPADAAATSPACEKSAADKKLAGAAKNSHIKKCMADEKAAAAPKK
ncbi:MAG TPA: phosphate starvation-inducible protein PsiF [Curvibacter sp.]|nr:phosphate starvation-inducible protein PsiF [Curvibacter sp.]